MRDAKISSRRAAAVRFAPGLGERLADIQRSPRPPGFAFLIDSSPEPSTLATAVVGLCKRSGLSSRHDHVVLGSTTAALDQILELTHVARPVVSEQDLCVARASMPRMLVPKKRFVVAHDEMIDQQANTSSTRAQPAGGAAT